MPYARYFIMPFIKKKKKIYNQLIKVIYPYWNSDFEQYAVPCTLISTDICLSPFASMHLC